MAALDPFLDPADTGREAGLSSPFTDPVAEGGLSPFWDPPEGGLADPGRPEAGREDGLAEVGREPAFDPRWYKSKPHE